MLIATSTLAGNALPPEACNQTSAAVATSPISTVAPSHPICSFRLAKNFTCTVMMAPFRWRGLHPVKGQPIMDESFNQRTVSGRAIMSSLTHFNSAGEAHMVDVGDKAVTQRTAIAE